MASAGVAALSAGPALAQQDSECMQRLDQMQDQLQQADVAEDRRADVQLVIDGARTLAETGDEQGCERVSAELDQLMQTITAGSGAQAAQAAGDQPSAQQSSQTGQQVGEADMESVQGQEQSADQGRQAQGAQQAADQGQQPSQEQAGQEEQTQGQQQAEDQGGQTAEAEADMTARLTIEQPQPQVTVHQQQPKVTVRIPKPVITIRMPPPEVSIDMPEPDVQVEMPEPDIRVTMAQPDLDMQGAEAQASSEQDQQVQANIDYQTTGQQQAEVDVQMEEPEIRFEQSEPQIDVARGTSDQQQAGQQGDAGQQQAAAQQGSAAEQIAGQADVTTPDHQARQAIDEAQMALQEDDLETARSALEDAQQNLQQVADQAGDEAQPQLDQVDQSVQQALDAIEQDDVEAAQQALEEAKAPMQQAMLQESGQQQGQAPQQQDQAAQQQGQAAQQQEGQTGTVAAGSAPEPGASISESPLAQLPASELLGQEVVNDQGDTVAEIVDMVKRTDGEDIYALLSVGGFLGIGEKQVAVPLDRLNVGNDQQIVMTNTSEDELESMPDWDENDPAYESLSQ